MITVCVRKTSSIRLVVSVLTVSLMLVFFSNISFANAAIEKDLADIYFRENYKMPVFNIVALQYKDGHSSLPDVVLGESSDIQFFQETLDFLENNDLGESQAYTTFINNHIDIDSYINYHINTTYLSDNVALNENLTIWRMKDALYKSKLLDKTVWHFYLGELSLDYKYDDISLIEDLLIKMSSDRFEDEINIKDDIFFENLSQNSNFIERYKEKLLILINDNYEALRLTDILNAYSMQQQILGSEGEGKWTHLSTYEYAKIIDRAKEYLANAQMRLMNEVSLQLQLGEIYKVDLNGFSRVSNAKIFFEDESKSFELESENAKILLFEDVPLNIDTPEDALKGFLVYQSGKFNYVSGTSLQIYGTPSKTRIIAITVLPSEILFSVEGIFVAVLLLILLFLIIRETVKRKRKKRKLWQ